MKILSLANAELSVMKLLWKEAQMTARIIREQLYPKSSKAQHGTVQKLLQRLELKGFIERDKSLSVHLFSPLINQDEYYSRELESLADKLTGGSLAPLITCFLENKKISQEDLNELRNILDDYKDDSKEN